MAGESLVVEALYGFKGSNNDELCFKKGDVITVTQKDDGWWEGTFDGKTGWFPSNYVKECKDLPKPVVQQDNQYKSIVLKDLIDSEKIYVEELEGLVSNYLQPLDTSNLLSQDEFKQLTGNINEVLDAHQQLLALVEQECAKPGPDQRVGKLFLNWAPKIKAVHQTYCSLHPRAVVILDKYKEELTQFADARGAANPSLLVLTTRLSLPFRRLERYPKILQELERHVEECHPDRGDTQRSVSIYEDIATTCSATKRQKELELQVLTGSVRGWEGPNLTSLGEIIYMGSVAVGPQHHDRYFVLFPAALVILSVSHRTSGFIYEGKICLSGLNVVRLEDTELLKNAFEISAPMIDKRVVICQSRQLADQWVDMLTQTQGSRISVNSTTSHKALPSQAQHVLQPPPHLANLNHRGYSSRSSILKYHPPLNYRPTYPPSSYPAAAPYAGLTRFFGKKIKDQTLSARLLRNLLYSEYLNKKNITQVKIRHHKTEVVIMTKNLHIRDSVINCDSGDCDSDSDEAGSSSSSSNPFGYIRYYNPKNGSAMVQEGVRYESFVDYGEPWRNQARVLEEPPKKPSIVLTSTAKLNLLHKQCSEDSEASSEMAPRHPGMACENLLTLPESFELESLNVPTSFMPMTRQSCPTKLVGNKFNQNSLTTVYIPNWSSSENNISCRTRSRKSLKSDSSSTTTHSSSLEVPVNTFPIPDKIAAELMYGQFAKGESTESDATEQSQQTVIKPPSILNASDTLSLNLETIPFRKHSINSDKPRRRCSIQINPTDLRNKALKRCVSSKYVKMRPSGGDHPAERSGKAFCRCGSEYCHSPRSSDSGMAGSCTLNSPDLANSTDIEQEISMMPLLDQERLGAGITLSEIEARNFECDCPCSSPFGSTPRTSSETSHTRDSLRTTSVTSMDMLPSQWGTQPQMHSRLSSSLGPQKSKSTSSILDRSDDAEDLAEPDEEDEDSPMFKSGLYAHWWLKAKLPPEIVRAIYEGTREKSKTAEVSTRIGSKP
ncbi:rho guanine nucleotide exchange factor 6 [Dendroctonus ponderosae]|uniref:rho guanine nucleotide exchange factor 6 n=1 Tax=Dendroctonus ponderosae TaxID=77166 RepID=UPI0020364462|nr:rho guanine nucleotide exchange factor 6 [Dendroctonus ponderosae]XP_048518702.1 rho guanine nucleotide exchange factor 6 [Dendroctonus ponderosae]XP_048518703.1 rho guanine nucleotide exchange factor 6 [Dendroctonus ponderosae]XP_048518704.1 rho guanine nucleotide exchange factor 6 [Dendroctonus ponderosae]